MEREEANARLVELQQVITGALTEAESIADKYRLEFTITSPRLNAHRDSITYCGPEEWLCSWEEETGGYVGRWQSSACW